MLSIFLQITSLLLFTFFFIFFVMQFYNMFFRGYAPFIFTRKRIIDKIIEEVKINNQATVYELGAGQAGFLRTFRKKYPQAKLIGIEFQLLPFLVGNIQSALTNCKIKFKKENFLKTDLSRADLIYCYLNPESMAKLKNKFKTECRPGTQIISYQFTLPGIEPINKIKIDNNNRIFFYKL